MHTCTECRGTGLRGADGTSPDHVGRMKTCQTCNGRGFIADEATAAQEDIHTADAKPSFIGAILQRIFK